MSAKPKKPDLWEYQPPRRKRELLVELRAMAKRHEDWAERCKQKHEEWKATERRFSPVFRETQSVHARAASDHRCKARAIRAAIKALL